MTFRFRGRPFRGNDTLVKLDSVQSVRGEETRYALGNTASH
jgi:hypothetical protein